MLTRMKLRVKWLPIEAYNFDEGKVRKCHVQYIPITLHMYQTLDDSHYATRYRAIETLIATLGWLCKSLVAHLSLLSSLLLAVQACRVGIFPPSGARNIAGTLKGEIWQDKDPNEES